MTKKMAIIIGGGLMIVMGYSIYKTTSNAITSSNPSTPPTQDSLPDPLGIIENILGG